MNGPRVSVIIPVRDDAARLETCLEALAAQTLQDDYEVIVADNGSSDDPASVVARHPIARLVFESTPNSYAARNAAVREAGGQILAFTDSDCIPASDWLERGCAALEAGGPRHFVGGRVEVFFRDERHPTASEVYERCLAFPQQHYLKNLGYCVTANLLTSAEAFAHVGEFDEVIVSGGDREWGQRAHRKGVGGSYADDVVVRHPARSSFKQLHRKVKRVQLGFVQLRAHEGKRLTALDVLRSLRPPLRTLLVRRRDLPRPVLRSAPLFVVATLFVHYANAVEQLRVTLHARRAGCAR